MLPCSLCFELHFLYYSIGCLDVNVSLRVEHWLNPSTSNSQSNRVVSEEHNIWIMSIFKFLRFFFFLDAVANVCIFWVSSRSSFCLCLWQGPLERTFIRKNKKFMQAKEMRNAWWSRNRRCHYMFEQTTRGGQSECRRINYKWWWAVLHAVACFALRLASRL